MYQDLQSNTLLLVTDTSVQKDGQVYYGFEPVVKEIEYFLTIFSSVEWIAFEDTKLREFKPHKIIDSEKVKITLLDPIGGKLIKDKLNIIKNYIRYYKIISKKIEGHHYIHVRAPSHPAVLAMFYSIVNRNSSKIFWFKYAGSWIDKAPFFYDLQRKLLKFLPKSNKITINGNFESNRSNFFNFQNPCLSKEDIEFSGNYINFKRRNYLFIGNLNKKKGVDLLVNTFKSLDSTICFLGGGANLDYYKNMSEFNANMNFLGQKPKSEVVDYLLSSKALILPSETEGFPKVISEAMNFGCIPIVSNVSCISEIISHKQNGYFLENIDEDSIKRGIQWVEELSHQEVDKIVQLNKRTAYKFTYEYYIKRVLDEIY